MFKKSGTKTPIEIDSSVNSTSILLDGGTGSEGGMGLKVALSKIHNSQGQQ